MKSAMDLDIKAIRAKMHAAAAIRKHQKSFYGVDYGDNQSESRGRMDSNSAENAGRPGEIPRPDSGEPGNRRPPAGGRDNGSQSTPTI